MREMVRILLVEDSADDAALMLQALRGSGFTVEHERVESADALTAALAARSWDVIICDYTLPGFGARAALEIVRNAGIDAPFIVVSGSVSERVAIAALEEGVDDYVMKDNLLRLGPTVVRACRDHRARVERKRAEERYRSLFENAVIGLYRSTPD